MRDTLNLDFFKKQLAIGTYIDEAQFYFADDPKEGDYMLGYETRFYPETPYWVSDCDLPEAPSFSSGEELLTAPIFDGQSLEERWDQVRFVNIMGIGLKDWLRCVPLDLSEKNE